MTQEELIDKLLELTSASSSKLAATTSEVASTFMGGFRSLWGGASSGAAASSADPKHVWLPIAKHLQRIAGNQVRPCLCLLYSLADAEDGRGSKAADKLLKLSEGCHLMSSAGKSTGDGLVQEL